MANNLILLTSIATKSSSGLALSQYTPDDSDFNPCISIIKMCLQIFITYRDCNHQGTEVVPCAKRELSRSPFRYFATTSKCHSADSTKVRPSYPYCSECQQARPRNLVERFVGAVDSFLGYEGRTQRRLALALTAQKYVRPQTVPMRRERKSLPVAPLTGPRYEGTQTLPVAPLSGLRYEGTQTHSAWGPGNSNRDSLFSFAPSQKEELTAAPRAVVVNRETGRGLGTPNNGPMLSYKEREEKQLAVAGLSAVDNQREHQTRQESQPSAFDSPSHYPAETDLEEDFPRLNPSSTTDDRNTLPSQQATLSPTSSLSPIRQGIEFGFGLNGENPEEVGLEKKSTEEVPECLIPGGPASPIRCLASRPTLSSPLDTERLNEDEVNRSNLSSSSYAERPNEDAVELPTDTPAAYELDANNGMPPTLPIPDYDGSSFSTSWDEFSPSWDDHTMGIPNDWSWTGWDTHTDTLSESDEELMARWFPSSPESSSSGGEARPEGEGRPGGEAYEEPLFMAPRSGPPTRFEDFEIPFEGVNEVGPPGRSLREAARGMMPTPLSFGNRALHEAFMNIHQYF